MVKTDKTVRPTDGEMEILQILWEHGASTVRFVNERLNEKKRVGYTTTLKIMQIMTEKGILRRKKTNRTHTYYPVLQEKETQNLMLDKILNLAFGGSASRLVMQTLGNKKTSQEELQKIKALIEKLEKSNDEPAA